MTAPDRDSTPPDDGETRELIRSAFEREPFDLDDAPVPAAPDRDEGTVEWAVDVVARAILYNAAQNAEWGDYPEIGELDWDRICDRLDALAPHPDRFLEAYDLLEKRAEVSDG